MSGRTWPGGISPSTPWPTTRRKGSSTPLGAGRTCWSAIGCGRWETRSAGLKRTGCGFSGSAASAPKRSWNWTPPPPGPLWPSGTVWTASRLSGSGRSCTSCWQRLTPPAGCCPRLWGRSCPGWTAPASRPGMRPASGWWMLCSLTRWPGWRHCWPRRGRRRPARH